MVVYKLVFSHTAPALRNVIWAKPVNGGFTLCSLEGGEWKPLKVVDDKGDIISTSHIKGEIVGTSRDSKNKMTLYGLKAYIDDAVANLNKNNK